MVSNLAVILGATVWWEWLLFVVIIGGPIALVVGLFVLSRRIIASREQAVSGIGQVAIAPDTLPQVLQSLRLHLVQQKGIDVIPNPDGSLTVQRRFVPAWAILVAILFFPLGLLALLARTTESATVLASGNHVLASGRPLTRSGTFYKKVVPVMESVIKGAQ